MNQLVLKVIIIVRKMLIVCLVCLSRLQIIFRIDEGWVR